MATLKTRSVIGVLPKEGEQWSTRIAATPKRMEGLSLI